MPNRACAHALQVGAGTGLGHGDGADHLAGGEPGQPALFLLLGAVMQDVGRHDAGMQRRAEGVEAGEREFPVDHRLMGEAATGTAIFLGHRRAQQAGDASLGPHLAVVDAGRVPAVDMGDEFIGDEAPRLLLEQDQVLAHPRRPRNVEGIHLVILSLARASP